MSAPAEVASVRVLTQALPEPGPLRVEVGELALCLARTARGNWYAVDDTCTHEDCSLSGGKLTGEAVECPCHGSCFDLASGDVLNLPAVVPLQTHRARLEQDAVIIEVEG